MWPPERVADEDGAQYAAGWKGVFLKLPSARRGFNSRSSTVMVVFEEDGCHCTSESGQHGEGRTGRPDTS